MGCGVWGVGCGVSGVNTHLSRPLPTALINKYNINLASLLVHKKSLMQFLALHLSLGFHYLLSSLLTCLLSSLKVLFLFSSVDMPYE